MPAYASVAAEREVEGRLGGRRGCDRELGVGERGLDRLGEVGDPPTEGRSIGRIQVLDRLPGPGRHSPLADEAPAQLGQVVGRRGRGDGGSRRVEVELRERP